MMNQSDINNDHKAAFARLNALEQMIEKQVATTKKSGTIIVVIAVVFVIFVAAYLTYGYSQIKQFTAETAVANAEYQIRQMLPGASDDFKTMLVENADTYVDNLANASLEAPAKARTWAGILAMQRIEAVGTEIEEELYTTLKAQLEAINTELTADNADLTPDQRYDALLDAVSIAFDEQIDASIDSIKTAYTRDSTALLTYLAHLNSGDTLTEKEIQHKKLIETMIAIVAKAAEEDAAN